MIDRREPGIEAQRIVPHERGSARSDPMRRQQAHRLEPVERPCEPVELLCDPCDAEPGIVQMGNDARDMQPDAGGERREIARLLRP